jgi:hypothetical protein
VICDLCLGAAEIAQSFFGRFDVVIESANFIAAFQA